MRATSHTFVVLCHVPGSGLSLQTIFKSSGYNNFVISPRICLKRIIWVNCTVGSTAGSLNPPAFVEV